MKLTKLIDNYVSEREFVITYRNNKLNIVNYSEILDFSSSKISVRYQDRTYSITGSNLVISKMFDDELLVIGDIQNITFS